MGAGPLEQVELAHQVQNAAVVVLLLDVTGHAGVHKAGGLGGQQVIERAAGHQPVVLRAGVDEQDRVVLPQQQILRPGPGGLLDAAQGGGPPGGDHGQYAPAEFIPVGVVEQYALLRAGGEHAGLVNQIGAEVGGAQAVVQGRAALRHLHLGPLGEAVEGGQGDGRDEDKGSECFVFQ